jgi:hypothetical protein
VIAKDIPKGKPEVRILSIAKNKPGSSEAQQKALPDRLLGAAGARGFHPQN